MSLVKYLREKFPELERIACYAMPMNVLKKSPEELKAMKEAGLDMLYLGIESGSDLILKKVTRFFLCRGAALPSYPSLVLPLPKVFLNTLLSGTCRKMSTH